MWQVRNSTTQFRFHYHFYTDVGGNGAGAALNQLSNPNGVYYDYLYTKHLYVVDSGNHRVLKFPPDSTQATFGTLVAGGNSDGDGPDQLNNPRTLLVDGSGSIYISDGGKRTVQSHNSSISQRNVSENGSCICMLAGIQNRVGEEDMI